MRAARVPDKFNNILLLLTPRSKCSLTAADVSRYLIRTRGPPHHGKLAALRNYHD